MKYQSEYQRNYRGRSPLKQHELTAEERKLNEIPAKRSTSSPTRARRHISPREFDDGCRTFAVVGPNEKFSTSALYRLKEPVTNYPRVAKSQEFALLGRNEKFENNIAYPLRKPVIVEQPKVVVRKRKPDNHSCGIQTQSDKLSTHPNKRDNNRKRIGVQTEYQHQYFWKQGLSRSLSDDLLIDRRESRSQQTNVKGAKSEKTSVGVNTPVRVEIDFKKNARSMTAKSNRPRADPRDVARSPRKLVAHSARPKAHEAENLELQRRKEIEQAERAYSDDEGRTKNTDLGTEFRNKYPHGKLRRWQSEYRSTYKPFWRFDYKDGKWYKDSTNQENSFNPNLHWYKELMSRRKEADQYRANAEKDHFHREHTLQLEDGFGSAQKYRAWDVDEDDNHTDSVISVDRDLERERLEGERRREMDARRNENIRIPQKINSDRNRLPITKADQTIQTDHHQTDRVIYIDEPIPRPPSVATKAFVRNLSSSSVQQQLSWDSQSLVSERTNSDRYQKVIIPRSPHYKHFTQQTLPNSYDNQPINMNSPHSNRREYSQLINPQTQLNSNPIQQTTIKNDENTSNATGQPSYDAYTFHKQSPLHAHRYCSYPANRFKDEVTEYYYRDVNHPQQHRCTPTFKPSFENPLDKFDERYSRINKDNSKEDDRISVNSARSLTSSCSLASQTLERAQNNMKKYWGERSTPKKSNAKN